jgi:hypothetical protein
MSTTQVSKSQSLKDDKALMIKSLKSTSDVENFYRFILDNNLRGEAYSLMKMVTDIINPKSKRKSKKIQ